jgi:hypothetical protein
MEEKRKNTLGPPPSLPSALFTMPTGMNSPEHAHSAPSPRQHPASTPPRPPRPALLAHAARHRPSMPLETLAPALSRAYKNPPSMPRRSKPSPLPIPTLLSSSLSLGNVRALGARAAAFWRSPATVGHAAGARRRSRAAAAVLRHRRRPLLPLHRAPAVEHSSQQAPVSSSPSRGRRRTCAVGF